MKRNIHRTVLLLALLGLICTLAVSCDSEPLPDDRLIGTWSLYQEGSGTSEVFIFTFDGNGGGKFYFYFQGAVRQAESDIRYSISGNEMVIETGISALSYLTCTYRLDGDSRLYLTGDNTELFPQDRYYSRVR